MTKMLLIGDPHIGRLETMFAKNWQAWSIVPFKQAIRYANKHKINHIICMGDTFDTPTPAQELLLLLIKLLQNTQKRFPSLIFHFELGNHDILDAKTNSLLLLKYLSRKHHITNCRIYLKPTAVLIDKVPVVFLPWPLTSHPFTKGKPKFVVAHVEKAGFKFDSGKTITDHDFDVGNNWWAIGHLHSHQSKPKILYTGAPLQLRYGDNKDKFLWCLTFKGSNAHPIAVHKIPVKLPYTLEMVRVNSLSENEWQRKVQHLAENAYLKLQVNNQVVLPIKYLRHPRITVEYFGTKMVKQDGGIISENINNDQKSRRKALKRYLTDYGLRSKRIIRALRMSDQFENQLNI